MLINFLRFTGNGYIFKDEILQKCFHYLLKMGSTLKASTTLPFQNSGSLTEIVNNLSRVSRSLIVF